MPKDSFILGFDFGKRHIGVAVGQSFTNSANPLTSLKASNGLPHWPLVDKIIKQWQPEAIVVGIPLNMDGTEQAITHFAKEFAMALKERFQIPVYGVDERLSTVEAREKIFAAHGYRGLKKTAIDQLSAQLILESWFKQSGHFITF